MLQLDSPYPFMQTMFAEAAAMRASVIRLDVAPALVFTHPLHPPDFSGLDEVVTLARAYHMEVVGDLFTIPWWIASCSTPTAISQMARCGTDDLAAYRSEISAIVARAGPVIRNWEIWNEPDLGGFFTGTPLQYAVMLRAAHDAIKQVDPQANVLLGGISGLSGQGWLAQVFAAVGPDAAHAFEIANVHVRDRLDALAGDVGSWKRFLSGYGFSGPLWVTEHGYPSDPAFQYDAFYAQGPDSQAAFLTASIPTVIDAGGSEVFVTERDNLGGQFAAEGILGGNVLDPPAADAKAIEKPAYAAVAALADCYLALGRDCAGPGPGATPASVTMPVTRLRSSTIAGVTVSDPGRGPLQLGAVTLAGGRSAPPTGNSSGPSSGPLAIQTDGCSNQILEPDHPCTVALRFTAIAGGAFSATLAVPSDRGTLSIPVTAVVPSVSSLTSRQLPTPAFAPTGHADGVGHTQVLVLTLTNPLSAPVHVAGGTLFGAAARQFSIQPNDCAGVELAPRGRCLVYLLFNPTHAGTDSVVLTLRGDGAPLDVVLRATAFALPAVKLMTATHRTMCFAARSPNRLRVVTDQPALVKWQAVLERHAWAPSCGRTHSSGHSIPGTGGSSASGRAQTVGHAKPTTVGARYTANVALPLGARGLAPGTYRLTVSASNTHGTGRARTAWFAVLA